MNENLSNRDPLYRKKHAGIPGNGGQTAEHPKSASGRLLVNPNEHKLDDRAEQLAKGGYVGGSYLSNVDYERTKKGRDVFWERRAVIAEYDSRASIPQMRRYNTKTGKKSMYMMDRKGLDGFKLETPSHAALHREADYWASLGQSTFDVPVLATGPGGNKIEVAVRVTRLGRDAWSTSPVGISGVPGDMIAEAVCAIGEARRGEKVTAIANQGDLIEKHALRDMSKGVTLQEVQSSWMSGMGHDPATEELFVEANGKVYVKNDVPTPLAYKMIYAREKGETSAIFNATVGFGKKSKLPSGGVAPPCPACKRFTSPTKTHMCAAGEHAAPSPDNVARNEVARAAAVRSLSSEDNRRYLEGQRVAGTTGKSVGADAPQPSAETVEQTPKPAPKPVPVKKPEPVFGVHVLQSDNKTTDVAARWAKQLDEPMALEGKPFFGAKRGWTIDAGIPDAIAPFTDSTHNYFNFDPKTGKYYDQGIDRFQGLDSATAAKLLHSIPADGLKDRQNNGPTLKNMLTASANSNGRVELSGHGVGPGRRDERLTADGAYLFDDSITTEKEAIAYAKNLGMTMKANPDEVSQEEVQWRPGEKAWRLWWD